MRIISVRDAAGLSRMAADIVASLVSERPDAVLGLPTGDTPLGLYSELAKRERAGAAGFSRVMAFAVDEFYGVLQGAPGTNAAYFAARVTLGVKELHQFRSDAPDPDAECRRFAALLLSHGPLDLVILGIGANGHIAFNEPGSPFDSRTRPVKLSAVTRRAHSRAFGGIALVPRTGLTIGVADILEARRALLLASGRRKAQVLARALRGPITTDVPASALQLHPDLTVVADRAAAAMLDDPEG